MNDLESWAPQLFADPSKGAVLAPDPYSNLSEGDAFLSEAKEPTLSNLEKRMGHPRTARYVRFPNSLGRHKTEGNAGA